MPNNFQSKRFNFSNYTQNISEKNCLTICEQKITKHLSKFFGVRKIQYYTTNWLNLVSQVSHRSVAEVTTYEYLFDSAPCIDLTFHCVYSRVFYGIACVRARATTVKKTDLSAFRSSPRSLSIIIRCLCSYLRYLLYYILDTYMCMRVCTSLYTNVRDSCISVLYIFIYGDVGSSSITFNLLYLSKERTQLTSVIWSVKLDNRLRQLVLVSYSILLLMLVNASRQLSVIGFSKFEKVKDYFSVQCWHNLFLMILYLLILYFARLLLTKV